MFWICINVSKRQMTVLTHNLVLSLGNFLLLAMLHRKPAVIFAFFFFFEKLAYVEEPNFFHTARLPLLTER